MWLPATDGTMKGFGYDMLEEGIVGPFDYPKIYHASKLELDRTEILFSDEGGNLLYFDSVRQNDRGDTFGVTTAATGYSPSYTPPAAENGYGTTTFESVKYLRSVDTVMETGMFDMGDPGTIKHFHGVIWSSVAGSRGIVEVTFTGEKGNTVTRTYGDMGDYPLCKHSLMMSIQDAAVKVKFRIISGDQKPWIIRDVTLLWSPQRRK